MHFSSSFKTTLFCLGISLFLFPSTLWSQFEEDVPYLKILGTVQDGGSPHIGCSKVCCNSLNAEQKKERKVTSIAVIHPKSNSSLLFEASPDIISQWKELDGTSPVIFLTHAHMGHYSGLVHLGREALGSEKMYPSM